MKIKTLDVFPGSVVPFAGATAPTGYLICDGSLVSRTAYAALFAAIGTVHGSGDGSTFQLPDYRGRFLRGSDNMGTGAAARDPDAGSRTAANAGGSTGATVGSVQAGGNASHGHALPLGPNAANGYYGLNTTYNQTFTSWSSNPAAQASGGNEARPQNANVNYIIKF